MLFQRLPCSFAWPLGSPDRQELRLLGGAPVCRQDSLTVQQLGAKKEYPRSHVACFGEASEVTQAILIVIFKSSRLKCRNIDPAT